MKLNKKFFLLLILCSTFNSFLRCEYIVFKKNGKDILPITNLQEHKKIYTVLQTYQWPMVAGAKNKLNRWDLEDLSKYGEETTVRKKIKEILPDYEIIFIPTTFYELFIITALSNYFEFGQFTNFNSEELNFFSSLKPFDLDSKILSILKNPKSSEQDIHNYYRQVNFSENLINAHLIINNAILAYLNIPRQYNQIAQLTVDKNMPTLLNSLINSRRKQWDEDYLYDKTIQKKIIDLEYYAHKSKVGVLYRGGKSKPIYIIGTKGTEIPIEAYFLATVRPITEAAPQAPTYEQLQLQYQEGSESTKVRNWNMPLNSLSFGNSIFAGYGFERGPQGGGACVCDYFRLDRIGYSLFIDKDKYLNNKLNSFFISSLNTLASLYSRGEFFHSRTKAFAPSEYIMKNNHRISVPGIIPTNIIYGKEIWPSFADNAGIFAPVGDPLEKAKELSEFIQTNAKILRVLTSEGAFKPKPQIEASYRKAQKDLTDALKAMVTIRKYIRLKEKSPRSLSKKENGQSATP